MTAFGKGEATVRCWSCERVIHHHEFGYPRDECVSCFADSDGLYDDDSGDEQ